MTTNDLINNLEMKPEEANELFGEETLQSMQMLADDDSELSSSRMPQVGCRNCGCSMNVNHGCQLPFSDCNHQSNCTHNACTNHGCTNNGDYCHFRQHACTDSECTNHGCPTHPESTPAPTLPPPPTPTPTN